MGFGSFLKKITHGVTHAVKTVAKTVKKVASGVVHGVKKVIGGASNLLGKLGPIGTIGMMMLMPGVGSMMAGMWQSAATYLSGTTMPGWLQAVGQGMNWAANAASGIQTSVGQAFRPITQKITQGLEYVGGNISDGANYLFKGAQEFAGVKDPASIGDVGEWVANKAKNMVGAPTTQAAQSANQFTVSNEIYDPSNKLGISNVVGKPEFPLSMQAQPMNVQFAEAAKQGIDPNVINTARSLNLSPFSTQANMANDYGIVASGIKAPTVTPPPIMYPQAEAQGPSLMDKIAKGAKAALGGMGDSTASTPYQPYTQARIPSPMSSSRGNVGGQGSAGGTFLTAAQKQQQSYLASILGQMA